MKKRLTMLVLGVAVALGGCAALNVWNTVTQIKAISASDTAPGSSERATLEAAIAIAEAEFDKQAKPRPPGT